VLKDRDQDIIKEQDHQKSLQQLYSV